MHTNTHARTHIHAHKHTQTQTLPDTHTHTYTRTHTNTHTHTHTFINRRRVYIRLWGHFYGRGCTGGTDEDINGEKGTSLDRRLARAVLLLLLLFFHLVVIEIIFCRHNIDENFRLSKKKSKKSFIILCIERP